MERLSLSHTIPGDLEILLNSRILNPVCQVVDLLRPCLSFCGRVIWGSR